MPLTFGRPETSEQAWIRLPDRDNPLYKTDQVFEHLAHLKDWFIETYIHILDGKWTSLENRFAPLSVQDMTFMKQISFVPGPPLVIAEWKHLPDNLAPWNEVFPTGDNEYRWWQVCPIIPQPKLPPGISFISVETNKSCDLIEQTRISDVDSEFELGWIDKAELKKLLKILR
jgi:hypothetical protein